jgi:tetratricopeptide (TPR) repeat protein
MLSQASGLWSSQFQEALALLESGQSARAQALCEDILKRQPRHAQSLHLLGLMAAKANDSKRAAVLIGKSIKIDPHNAVAYLNRGSALLLLDRSDAALDDYAKAIELDPAFAAAYFSRARALQHLRRLDDSLASYDQGIAIQPQDADAWLNRGNLLAALRRWDAALVSYNRSIAIRPDLAAAYCNRGNVLKELNRMDEALASYDRAIAFEPEYAIAYVNRGVTLLLAGELERGWIDFEWRWKINKRISRQPLWGGGSLAGKTILLHGEQGYGDTLQFCRYAPKVAELGAKVVLQVQKPLAALMAGLEGVSRIVQTSDAPGDIDYQCPLLSLPVAFKTALPTIPSCAGYLRSSQTKVAQWKLKLGTASKPRIGLVWSGGTMSLDDHRRVPLADLISHLPAGFQYVCLQKESNPLDRQVLEDNPAIENLAEHLADFSDTAALCDCMDLVISVDTSVAHLSGALGKPTWILLSFSPDWRWLLNRSDSPWYPSVKLYRQHRPDDWSSVLARVRADLDEEFKHNSRLDPMLPKSRPRAHGVWIPR